MAVQGAAAQRAWYAGRAETDSAAWGVDDTGEFQCPTYKSKTVVVNPTNLRSGCCRCGPPQWPAAGGTWTRKWRGSPAPPPAACLPGIVLSAQALPLPPTLLPTASCPPKVPPRLHHSTEPPSTPPRRRRDRRDASAGVRRRGDGGGVGALTRREAATRSPLPTGNRPRPQRRPTASRGRRGRPLSAYPPPPPLPPAPRRSAPPPPPVPLVAPRWRRRTRASPTRPAAACFSPLGG